MDKKMKMPLVSVIITTKNSERTLNKCLNSIKEQTYPNIELMVVDNNSKDKTKEIAKKYTKLVFNKGPERSAQRNFGAEKARGEYLYFVDADFVLENGVIQQCINKIQEGFNAIVVHNTPDISISWIAKIRKFETDMYRCDLSHSAARFFNKKIFLGIKGYNEEVTAGEDYDIQNKLNRGGYKTSFIEAEAIHLGEPTSFWRHMGSYYNYGKDFRNYKRYNKQESKKQLGFLRPVYFKHWKKFVRNPIMGMGFIFYHISKFIAGGLGYLNNERKW